MTDGLCYSCLYINKTKEHEKAFPRHNNCSYNILNNVYEHYNQW